MRAAANDYLGNKELQKRLVGVASRAQKELDRFARGSNLSFINSCKLLRVLNGLRDPNEAGIPLTMEQFQILGNQVVLSRLINRRHFALAIELCE